MEVTGSGEGGGDEGDKVVEATATAQVVNAFPGTTLVPELRVSEGPLRACKVCGGGTVLETVAGAEPYHRSCVGDPGG